MLVINKKKKHEHVEVCLVRTKNKLDVLQNLA
jgi:hypothetical protein